MCSFSILRAMYFYLNILVFDWLLFLGIKTVIPSGIETKLDLKCDPLYFETMISWDVHNRNDLMMYVICDMNLT